MEYVSGEIKQIGPETAENMLQHVNEEFQRRLVKSHVKHLASIMLNGDYLTGHIVVANMGGEKRIANGQHTLHAVGIFGDAVRCLVERYKCADDDDYLRLFHAYDTENRQRTFQDSAKAFLMAGGAEDNGVNHQKLLNLFRSGLECLWITSGGRAGMFGVGMTRFDRFSEAVSRGEEFSFLVELDKTKEDVAVLRRAAIVAAIVITYQSNTEKARHFWRQVVSGWFDCKNGDNDYAPLRLNKFLMAHRMSSGTRSNTHRTQRLTQGQCYAACVRCWNCYVKGKGLKSIHTDTKANSPVKVLAY